MYPFPTTIYFLLPAPLLRDPEADRSHLSLKILATVLYFASRGRGKT